ncbi:tetratricopeptide repeat protein [Pseudoalteromonas luteoviolacea]|uniref:tetratricopeptide repeat protein n=1 Tax=Pseudoalteromonas luteoviolacea TaxID=43657 RepID=UPI0005673480|nr:tetratricopeptide repeat protein [Pseudoalteromonas luteoviolacea]KZN29206.1 hypothetical protein N483_07170 [Pseudoalteromonas luteoviolacea NCIMB 1944]
MTLTPLIADPFDCKGDYDKAIAYFELALAQNQKLLGKEHPSTKVAAKNLEYAKELAMTQQKASKGL